MANRRKHSPRGARFCYPLLMPAEIESAIGLPHSCLAEIRIELRKRFFARLPPPAARKTAGLKLVED
jgi:hypothetical protein